MPEPEPLPAEPSLKELGTAVADAAGVATGLWISYLFVLFYMLVAAAGVTHKDLFLQNGIKLPFLSVDLPLKGFFVLGPLLLLIVHAYVLLHFVLFADKARQFAGRRTAEASGDAGSSAAARQHIPADAGRTARQRRRPTGRVSVLIAWATLVSDPRVADDVLRAAIPAVPQRVDHLVASRRGGAGFGAAVVALAEDHLRQ